MARIDGSVSKNGYSFYTEVEEIIPSDYISTNKTNPKISVYIQNHGTRTSSGGWKFVLKVDGVNQINLTSQTVKTNDVATQGGIKKLMEVTVPVTHNNDGTKKISIEAYIEKSSYTQYDPGRCSLSGEVTLTTIPRYPSVSQSLKSKTEKSLTINWSSDSTIDYVWYSIDGGTNYTAVGSINATSGNYTISGLSVKNPGEYNKYNIVTKLRRKDSQLSKESSILEESTYNAPYVKNPVDFVVGDSINLELYNPLKRSVQVYIMPDDGTDLAGDTTSTESINIDITEELKNGLYQASPNSATNRYRIKVVCSAIDWTMYTAYKNYTIPNSPPDFEGFNYLDSNNLVVGITGSNQYIVKNKSVLKVTIPSANKMVTKNYATPDRYEVSCANRNKSVAYSDTDVSVELGTINSSGLMNIVVTAYDSRGFPTKKSIEINVIDYTEVSQENGLYRVNQFERDTKLILKGTFDPLKINDIAKNTIQNIKYRYKQSDGEYPENYTTIIPTINNNKYEYETISFDLDNSKSFLFEIIVVDKFGDSKPLELELNEGIPIMFVSSTNRNIGVGCQNDHGEGSLETASDFYCGGNIYLKEGTPLFTYRVVNETEE